MKRLFSKLFFGVLIACLSHAVLSQKSEEIPAPPTENIQPQFSLEELKMFARLFEQVKQNYIEEVSDSELLDMAITGMLEQLDPHSELLEKDKREFLEKHSKGTFFGVGLELTMEEGELTVVTPIDGSPAAKAGLEPGDVIIEINNQSVWGMSLNEALELIDKKSDEPLNLIVDKKSNVTPIEISLTRENISIASIVTKTITSDIGYLRIRHFQRNTGSELQEKLQQLLDEHPQITGIVLDLRNNPGGVLQAAVEVTDAFIADGLIVTTRGRTQASEIDFYASSETVAPTTPLVILINRGSASASEIVAGALQDHNRGLVMGDISFGKGSVQNIVPIDDERAIKLTTARYYTPSGRSIQAQGIFPDISVIDGDIHRDKPSFRITEADLVGHLENINISANVPELLGMHDTLSDIDDLQLAQAVSFLKGLALYRP